MRTDKHKFTRRKEITKIRNKWNRLKWQENLLMKLKAVFKKYVNKIDKCLARSTKKKKEDSNRSISERGDMTTDTTEIQKVHYIPTKWTM